jgi:hypothetical protein
MFAVGDDHNRPPQCRGRVEVGGNAVAAGWGDQNDEARREARLQRYFR